MWILDEIDTTAVVGGKSDSSKSSSSNSSSSNSTDPCAKITGATMRDACYLGVASCGAGNVARISITELGGTTSGAGGVNVAVKQGGGGITGGGSSSEGGSQIEVTCK